MIKKKLIEPQTSTGLSLNDVSNQRIYTIDVRLFTYSTANFQPTPKEFTGINTLSIEYFKDNVGFGITNIDISINTSLQPVIEITFKDLYGNTVFSRDSSSSNPNFSDIFDWPPPKFDLVYKGYLGKPTRLMLNLKKTDIQYSSSDGSFIIKCSFVPNAWGPFADVPALFLYAVKKLKIDENLGNGDATKIITFFATLGRPKSKSPFTRVHKNPQRKTTNATSKVVLKDKKQQQIDEILDKISQSGYDSLTQAEKEFLFRAGNE